MKNTLFGLLFIFTGLSASKAQSTKATAYELTGSNTCYQSSSAFYTPVSTDPISCPPTYGSSREFWTKFTATTTAAKVVGSRSFSNSFSLQMTTASGTELLCAKGAITTSSSYATVNQTVTGLTIGQVYYVRVVSDALGPGDFKLCVTAISPPAAPTSATAVEGFKKATVSFTPPAGTVSSYKVTSNPGNFTATGTSSPLTVNGLTAGVSYTFTVTATNSGGTGPASASTNAVVPTDVPGIPLNIVAQAGDASAQVSFDSPSSNGGLVITNYEVTSSPDNITVAGTSSPLTVTGLSNGISYTFSVKAQNANGYGDPSSASNPVTPATVTDVHDMEQLDASVVVNEVTTASFSVHSALPLQAIVIDAKGVTLETFTVENTRIFGTEYPPGVYILKLNVGTQIKTVKLIKF